VFTIGGALDKEAPRLTKVGLVSAPKAATDIDRPTLLNGAGTTEDDNNPVQRGGAAGAVVTLRGTEGYTGTGGAWHR